jgi:hypothetical protein
MVGPFFDLNFSEKLGFTILSVGSVISFSSLRQQIGKQAVVGWLDGFFVDDDDDGGDRGVDGLAVSRATSDVGDQTAQVGFWISSSRGPSQVGRPGCAD